MPRSKSNISEIKGNSKTFTVSKKVALDLESAFAQPILGEPIRYAYPFSQESKGDKATANALKDISSPKSKNIVSEVKKLPIKEASLVNPIPNKTSYADAVQAVATADKAGLEISKLEGANLALKQANPFYAELILGRSLTNTEIANNNVTGLEGPKGSITYLTNTTATNPELDYLKYESADIQRAVTQGFRDAFRELKSDRKSDSIPPEVIKFEAPHVEKKEQKVESIPSSPPDDNIMLPETPSIPRGATASSPISPAPFDLSASSSSSSSTPHRSVPGVKQGSPFDSNTAEKLNKENLIKLAKTWGFSPSVSKLLGAKPSGASGNFVKDDYKLFLRLADEYIRNQPKDESKSKDEVGSGIKITRKSRSDKGVFRPSKSNGLEIDDAFNKAMILVGEVSVGNDSKVVKHQLSALIDYLLFHKAIDRKLAIQIQKSYINK